MSNDERGQTEQPRLLCKCMSAECSNDHFDERGRASREQLDIPPSVRTVKAMRNRRRVIE